MNLLDMKTVIVSYMITNVICALVMTMLWGQHRRRFDGLGFWLANFVAQVIALILVILRGVVPDFISMTVSNALVMGGTMLLLAGLERFLEKRRPQFHNVALLTIFIFTHAYFVYIYPSLEVRNIIFSLGLLVICSQCAWLMLRRVNIEMRQHTRNAGILFVAYCVVSIIRILVDIVIPAENNFLHSNVYDTLAVMLYQMLFIGLTFSLLLMVDHRLVVDLETDIAVRKETEGDLRLSDEKFQKAFHASPDSILITKVDDGQIVEANESFTRVTGYSREETLGTSTVALNLWTDPQDRASFVTMLRENGSVRNVEYDFRVKSGRILRGTISAETIQLWGGAYAISIIHDITESKGLEEKLRESAASVRALIENVKDIFVRYDLNLRYQYVSPVIQRFLDATPESFIGKTHREAGFPEDKAEFFDASLREAIQSKKPVDVEFSLQGRGGEYIMQTRVYPELDEKGEVISVVTVTSDITERKRVEEALVRSQGLYQDLVERQVVGVYRIRVQKYFSWGVPDEPHYEYEFMNDEYCRLTGVSREEHYADPTLTLKMIHPEDYPSFAQKNEEVDVSLEPFVWEGRMIIRGETRWVHYESCPRHFPDKGEVWTGVLMDITERRQMVDMLRASEERYQAFIAQSFEAIYRTEFDHPIDTSLPVETQIDLIYENGYMAECNQALADMYNLPSTKIVGMRLIDAHGGKDNPINRAAFKRFIQSVYKSLNDETMEYGGTGSPVWFLSNTVGIVEGGFLVRMWGTSLNITERKKAEIQLRNSEQKYQLLFDTMGKGVVYQNADGHITSANPAAERILGLTLDQMQGRTSTDPRWHAIHEDGSPFPGETHPAMVALRTGAPLSNVIMGVFNPQVDEYRWISVDAVPQFRDGEKTPYQAYTVFEDITERRQSDETFKIRLKLFELSPSSSLEELMQKALDDICVVANSPIGFYHFVEEDQKTISLQAWSTRTLKEFCKAEGVGLHYPIDQAGVWTDCVAQRKPVIHNDYLSLPHRKGLPPGHADVIREMVVPILRRGRVVSILGVGNKPSEYTEKDVRFVSYIADIIWEIVERKRAEDKLQQLSRAVEQSPASIVITDTTGKIEYVNPRFTEVTGYSAEEAIGQNPRILKTELTPTGTHRELWKTIMAGRDWQGEFVNRKKNGTFYYELASISPILDAHGSITHYVAVKENITERKESQLQLRSMNEKLAEQIKENLKLQEILREQAIRDPLTGLYNRRYLYETMGRELARARREKYPISFMMMDIDHFKQFNDTYGHDAGDMVLVALAELLRTHTRQGDIACRYGGEEFLVIMPQVGEADAKWRAEEIRHNFTTLRMDYNGDKISATISIGIAFYPRDGGDSDTVIKAADTAMYKAKQAGRNCVRVWEAPHESF